MGPSVLSLPLDLVPLLYPVTRPLSGKTTKLCLSPSPNSHLPACGPKRNGPRGAVLSPPWGADREQKGGPASSSLGLPDLWQIIDFLSNWALAGNQSFFFPDIETSPGELTLVVLGSWDLKASPHERVGQKLRLLLRSPAPVSHWGSDCGGINCPVGAEGTGTGSVLSLVKMRVAQMLPTGQIMNLVFLACNHCRGRLPSSHQVAEGATLWVHTGAEGRAWLASAPPQPSFVIPASSLHTPPGTPAQLLRSPTKDSASWGPLLPGCFHPLSLLPGLAWSLHQSLH